MTKKQQTLFEAIIKEWNDRDIQTSVSSNFNSGDVHVTINVKSFNIEGKEDLDSYGLYRGLIEVWEEELKKIYPNEDIDYKKALEYMPENVLEQIKDVFRYYDSTDIDKAITGEMNTIGDMYLQLIKGVCLKYINNRDQELMSKYKEFEGMIRNEAAKFQKNSP